MKPENLGVDREIHRRRPAPGLGRNRVAQEPVEQELDAEIVHGAAEVDGRLLPRADRRQVEGMAGAVEHGQLVDHLGVAVESSSLARTAGSSREVTRTGAW